MLLITVNTYSSNLGLENYNFVVIIVIIDSGKNTNYQYILTYCDIHIWKSTLSVTAGE